LSEKEMIKIADKLPKNSWKMKKTLFEKWQEEKTQWHEEKTQLLERLEKMKAKDFQFVQSLIVNTEFDDEKIALLANTSLDLVKKIRKDLNLKSKQ
jgi:hypothetical protein